MATILFLTSCTLTESPSGIQQLEENQSQPSKKETSFQENIENWDTYKAATEEDREYLVTASGSSCIHLDNFMETVIQGEIKKLTLYKSDPPWPLDLRVYLTPNYEQWITGEFQEKLRSCGELGTPTALKAHPDHLLWGYPNCNAGLAPSPNIQPAYLNYTECIKVQEKLDEYLSQG